MTDGHRAWTWLFSPATEPRRCLKALDSGADRVIWDWEDGVPSRDKDRARGEVVQLLDGPLSRQPWIRVNSAQTPDFTRDLQALKPVFHRVMGLVVPKWESESIRRLTSLGFPGQWLLLIETARGLDQLLLASNPWPLKSARLGLGAIDYRNDIGAFGDEAEQDLILARSILVMKSRVWGWSAPIDAVTPYYAEPKPVEQSASLGRSMGMGGKMIIHPAQIAPVHRAYHPSGDEIRWARAIVDAQGDSQSVAVDGAMADKPVFERARQILADAARGLAEH